MKFPYLSKCRRANRRRLTHKHARTRPSCVRRFFLEALESRVLLAVDFGVLVDEPTHDCLCGGQSDRFHEVLPCSVPWGAAHP